VNDAFRTYRLEIPLKGGRSYLRGADIYSAVADCILAVWPNADGRCKLAFHRLPRSTLELVVGPVTDVPRSPEEAVAKVSFAQPKGLIAGWILETSSPVMQSITYDEDALVDEVAVEGTTISPSGPRKCAPIDLAVVLTKMLHNRLRPLSGGKWIFTRLDIERPFAPSDAHAMSITLASELGTRLTRSDVRISGKAIGSIFFSVGQT
jgi:hypothetical protein